MIAERKRLQATAVCQGTQANEVASSTPPFGEISWMSWVTPHRQSAALSARGTQRVVPQSRHNIQVDHPQPVVDAISEVLDAVKTP